MKPVTKDEKYLIAQVLEKVLGCLTKQDDVSEFTRWTDNGNFIIAMSTEQKESLTVALSKLKNG